MNPSHVAAIFANRDEPFASVLLVEEDMDVTHRHAILWKETQKQVGIERSVDAAFLKRLIR